ncbi:uncharacterized protein EV422DRAFT_522174 [Fimicolochytrium jonesii]|uniref:uncharacterized protein n=1 Tax=Fimicolochytrium jonesii TaxID=1396493 RepID=UPI0022FF24C6|nr:uncharacterized protein EV422DRAFT_522174 [Fimicolochytrium jonesii]KAI8823740.1 hypothetical protein EV422DRAFT_522174 [Fimicolochytrium jonesii]
MVDYEHFLAQLRQKEAAPLMAHLKSFLARFNSEKRPILQHRKLVASFLHYIYGESLQNDIFAHCTSDDDLENIREGWEKLVMMNIYDRVFGAAETDDTKLGNHLQRKIDSFQWVQEQHLDLPFSFHHTLEVAQAELLRLNGFRAPRDKLVILQNTAQIVVDLIKKASENDAAGNDHLLPTLILTIIRANPPNLIANIKYIMRFRNQTELDKGTNQFCITNMMSAVSFIYNMTPKSLTLNEEEAQRYAGVGGGLGGRAGEGSSSSSSGTRGDPAVPQVSQLASKVYTSTSGWFNSLIREAKVFGEQAAGKVDGFVNQVVGDSDEEDNRVNQGQGQGPYQHQQNQYQPIPGTTTHGEPQPNQTEHTAGGGPPIPARPPGVEFLSSTRSSSMSAASTSAYPGHHQQTSPQLPHRQSTPTGQQLRQQLRQQQQQQLAQHQQQQSLHPLQATGAVHPPWMMEHSPTVSPMSPLNDASPAPPPRPPANAVGGIGAGPRRPSTMSPAEQEDYELQLAMALSLSTVEDEKRRREEGGEFEVVDEDGEGGDAAAGKETTVADLVDVQTEESVALPVPPSSLTSQTEQAAKPYTVPDTPAAEADKPHAETLVDDSGDAAEEAKGGEGSGSSPTTTTTTGAK